MAARGVVHGDDLLYRFMRGLLSENDPHLSHIPESMVRTMAIWLPVDVYEQLPILLPWVVRDPTCRASAALGRPDRWGAPNRSGYLRDDNSLVKAIPRSLTVDGPRGSHLRGKRMGTEFVACHIWRKPHGWEDLASRHPLLNTFVPNLVWLPKQVAKLSDIEGGVIQETLKAMSWDIYRTPKTDGLVLPAAEQAWSLLPQPRLSIASVAHEELNWFRSTPAFIAARRQRIRAVRAALERLERGLPLESKVVTTRYTEGLPEVPAAARAELKVFLSQFDIQSGSGLLAHPRS